MNPTSLDSSSSPPLVPELAREAHSLFERGMADLLLSLATAVALLWALRAVLRGLRRVSAHLGADRERRFARLSRMVQFVAVLLVIGELVRSAAQVAPVWMSSVLIFVVAPMALWSSGLVQDLVAGAVAHIRLNLTEGDYVRIGEARGVLTRLGVVHLDLRDELGKLHRIPNRMLTGSDVEVCEYRGTVPVSVELSAPRPLSDEDLDRLSDGTATSPYRAPGTRLSVERAGTADRVRVQFFVWSQQAVTPARRRLERMLARLPANGRGEHSH